MWKFTPVSYQTKYVARREQNNLFCRQNYEAVRVAKFQWGKRNFSVIDIALNENLEGETSLEMDWDKS